MSKLNVCILFGGISPEHAVSLRSAESVLNNIDHNKYNVFPVGITREGKWIFFAGKDYAMLPAGTWMDCEGNCDAAISPVRGQGLLCFTAEGVTAQKIDVVFPVLHGENGEDGAMQGLLQMAGIPYVGPHVSASAVAMDKTLTKLVVDKAGVPQAAWELVLASRLGKHMDSIVETLEQRFTYPMFVKPAGTGSSVGVSKAADRASLEKALLDAGKFDEKILVEEFIHGREVEVAVMGNENPVASVVGEVVPCNEFYDYDAKYNNEDSKTVIAPELPAGKAEEIAENAVKIFRALDGFGLSRVDFFMENGTNEIVFNEINTLPGFTSISMYPMLWEAKGITKKELVSKLLELAYVR